MVISNCLIINTYTCVIVSVKRHTVDKITIVTITWHTSLKDHEICFKFKAYS